MSEQHPMKQKRKYAHYRCHDRMCTILQPTIDYNPQRNLVLKMFNGKAAFCSLISIRLLNQTRMDTNVMYPAPSAILIYVHSRVEQWGAS